MNFTPIDHWIEKLKHPLVVAGPCSADNEESMIQTAIELAKIPSVRIFRAGIWKPRTRPGIFDGIGEKGLPWLKSVKKETGLLTSTEVANGKHVELALKNEVDILWIGARSSANPFSVQEIADALKGVDVPVMIKNPINSDLSLWIGAIERVANVGINKIVGIHRGFSTHFKTRYRNAPLWQIPIELKHHYPTLPIICDPSHICGNTELIPEVCQKAMDVNMDGLMIECHISPENSLSDHQQHLTPGELSNLMEKLVLRTTVSNQKDFENELEQLRLEIDRVDSELLNSLQHRINIVRKIAQAKIKSNVTALQLDRMEEMIKNRKELAKKLGIPENFSYDLFKLIHAESVKTQTNIMKLNREIDQ